MESTIFQPNTVTEHSLCPFWFWNDLIEPDEIERQLTMMAGAGVRQAIIHARNGLATDYLSERWFSDIRFAMTVAARLGMKLWLYDEKDWPSGNCDCTITLDPVNRESFLLFAEIPVTCGDPITAAPAAIDARHLESYVLLNVTLYTPDGAAHDLLARHGAAAVDGTVCAEADGTVWVVWRAVDEYQPLGRLAADYMSRRVMGEFLDSTHRRYEAALSDTFGNTASGIFMDETRFLNAYPWTDEFAEAFAARKGYDPIPLLPLLRRDTAESAAFRYDYFDTVAHLMQQNTFRQVYDWCEAHHLQTVAHVLGEETLATQARFNADILRHYRYIHLPSIDHLGNGIGSLDAKVCSSAAHHYGHLTVGAECMGACGWNMDCESVIRITNWLFQQGINHLIPHAFYYSIRGDRANDWPPSYFFQWKDWERMPAYAAMTARMSGQMRGAVNATGLLVYYPVETYWTQVQHSTRLQTCYFENGPDIVPEAAARQDEDWQRLCAALLDDNQDFELFGADAADCFAVADGRLVNRRTGAAYRAFVLAGAQYLPDTVVTLLNAFMAAGGTVIALDGALPVTLGVHGEHRHTPDALPVLDTASERFVRVPDIARLLSQTAAAVPAPFRIVSGKARLNRTRACYPDHLIDPYLHFGEDQTGVGAVAYRRDGQLTVDLVNYDPSPCTVTVEVAAAAAPTVWLPETDERFTPPAVPIDGGYAVTVSLPPNRTVFLLA